MNLWIEDSGCSTAEIEKGIAAAMAVFRTAGVSASESFAAFKQQMNEEPHDPVLAALWIEAEREALTAAQADWARPGGGSLEPA